MTIAVGSLITAADYNALAALINKVYDDIYSGATPVNPVTNAAAIANYKFGWGGTAVTAVSISDLITDEQLNNIICRANIGVDITNNTPSNLTYIDQHMLMTAADWLTVNGVLDLLITNKNNMDPTEQTLTSPSATSNGTSIDTRTTAWGATGGHGGVILDSVFEVDFTSYDNARYFFNAGGQHHILGAGASGSTVAYTQWVSLFSQMGSVIISLDNTTQTGTGGTSTNKGFYDCIVGDPTNLHAAEWTLLFTTGAGTGAYGCYGTYSGSTQSDFSAWGGVYTCLGLRVYGMLNTAGDKWYIKVTLDNSAITTIVDGTTTIELKERRLNNQTCTTTTTVSTPFTILLTPYDPQYAVFETLEVHTD